MFLGEYDRSLDDKGRLVLPAEHREQLGETGFITKALDDCLAIFPPEEFEEVMAKMEQYARQGPEQRRRATLLSSGAHQIVPDKQGRIAIAPKLRDYADLRGDVKVVGGNTRIEIWDVSRWYAAHPQEDQGFDPADPALAALGI